MSNKFYPKGLQHLSLGHVDLIADTIKMLLVSLDYTYSASHEFHSDVARGAIVATSPALSGKSATVGVFDAADVTFSAVVGSQVRQVIFYQETGTSGTSILLAIFNVATGLPL